MSEPVDFVAKLEELRAKRGQSLPQPPPEPTQEWSSGDLLPDLGGNISEAGRELDAFVDKIDIIDAYNKWCGKMAPEVNGKREGIMISCPNPDHPDKVPSAWINLDKQTYFCGGCQQGGDSHDIAAFGLGYPVPGYKDGESFHNLREQMAESFGFRSKKVAGGTVTWIESQNEGVDESGTTLHSTSDDSAVGVQDVTSDTGEVSGKTGSQDSVDNSNVSHMWAEEEDDEPELVVYPTIDWRNLIPEDTFLYEYLNACSSDDAPEEYHFWHGLMALGLVVGRKVTLDDTQPVYGNLLLCILGATGTGKSRSRRHLNAVLKESSPYREDGSSTTGVKLVPVPGSGEHLVSQFSYMGKDPTNNKTLIGYQPVTGIVDFDEMSSLLARASRQGSTLKPTIMQLADAVSDVRIGSMTMGDKIAHEPFCSITASTQPKAIRTLLNRNDTGSGFLNRWIFAGGKQKQIEALGGRRSGIVINLDRAIDELKKVRGWGAMERSVEMEDEAYLLYEKFFRTKIEPAKIKDDTDLLKRIDLIVKKLMLLLTINLRKEKVPAQVVEAVINLYDYVLECYGILNSNIGVTLMQDVMMDLQNAIIKHITKTKRGASVRDINRSLARKNYSLEQIKKAIDVMTALDMIELEKKPAGPGRPTARYTVVGA